jgi:hypothetical protein
MNEILPAQVGAEVWSERTGWRREAEPEDSPLEGLSMSGGAGAPEGASPRHPEGEREAVSRIGQIASWDFVREGEKRVRKGGRMKVKGKTVADREMKRAPAGKSFPNDLRNQAFPRRRSDAEKFRRAAHFSFFLRHP